ncbi:hypothetical protein CYMTET_36804 [Cymbomonas tetramitiformis]|uniref:Uncharacterized protein n=1 Tax=Cymbomonas tetramitiformis TaxID=36881 RepID=A0AAE0CF83_9CHLO|nr:hypothetical protein CYMTET_36804 [Cymbomonas tetramitiformis]
MFVPSDSFGGKSPERKAAEAMRNLFTFVAARVVLAQLEGSGRGALGAYDAESYEVLSNFLLDNPIQDCDKWCSELMNKNSKIGKFAESCGRNKWL